MPKAKAPPPPPPQLRGRVVVTVTNQKGGVGKTTITINLGGALAAMGLKVRITDADPQDGSATHYLTPQTDVGQGLLDVYEGNATLDQVTSLTSVPGLYIVPSWTQLRKVERDRQPGDELVLKNALAASTAPIDVDLIDSSPALGVLAVGATAAADYLVVPVQASELDTVGMGELLGIVDMVRQRISPNIVLATIVVNKMKARALTDQEVVEKFKVEYPDSDVALVSDTVRLRESVSAHQTINQYDPRGKATKEFRAMAAALVERWI